MQRQHGGLVPNRGLKLAMFSGVWACHNGMFENCSLFTREGRLGNSWHTQIPRGTPGPTHHASIQTTERYLGVRQDLHDAPCDRLGLDVRAP